MAAHLIESLWVTGFGTIAASGYAYFYQPNTLTPVSVYSNDAATTVVTQPVRLDANGRSSAPLYVKVPARAIIQNSSGATLVDIERIDGDRAELVASVNPLWPNEPNQDAVNTALALSLGGTDGNFRAGGTGSVARTVQAKLSEQLSVKDFGATGNGVADDTGAIIATVAAAVTLGGGLIFFPAGTYLISQQISISQANILLQGVGPTASVVKNSSSTGNAFSLSGAASNITFSNIGISASTSSSGAAISMSGGSSQLSIAFNICSIAGHRTGIGQTSVSLVGMTMVGTQITTDNNAAAVCLSLSAASQVAVYGGSLQATQSTVAGVCVSLGATGDFFMFGCFMLGLTGVSTAGGNFSIYGGEIGGVQSLANLYLVTGGTPKCTAIGASLPSAIPTNLQKSLLISSATGGAYGDSGPYLTSNVAVSGAYSVTNLSYRYHRVVGTAGGITITVTAPSTAYAGSCHTVVCANNSGGAVTWAFSAAYRAAAVAPATGNQVALTFLCIDPATPVFVEISRGSVVAI